MFHIILEIRPDFSSFSAVYLQLNGLQRTKNTMSFRTEHRTEEQIRAQLTKFESGFRCNTLSHSVNVSSRLNFNNGKFSWLKMRQRSTDVSLASMVVCTVVNKFSISRSLRLP